MKSANENALAFAEKGLEAMGSSFPRSEVLKIVRIRETLLQYPDSHRPMEDFHRAEAIIAKAQDLGIV